MLHFYPSQAVDNSTQFEFDEAIACGDDATKSFAFTCDDLGGNSTCIPASEATEIANRNTVPFSKRGVECDKYNGLCRDQYQSQSSFCASGYYRESFEVRGYTTDI